MQRDPERSSHGDSILWIDDQIHAGSAEVRFLVLGGFRVDCAATGEAGLSRARSGVYGLILLDLRLPDESGLGVLKKLSREGVSTSVVVLTAFGDFEAARRAGMLGAVRFEGKPIFAERLLELVSTVIAASPTKLSHRDLDRARDAHDPHTPVRTLLAHVDSIAAGRQPSLSGLPEARQAFPVEIIGHTGPLLRILVDAMVRSEMPVPAFLACAEAFRIGISEGFGRDGAIGVRLALNRGMRAAVLPRSELVEFAVTSLEGSKRPHAVKEEDLARQRSCDPAHLGRRISHETGPHFREWRSGVVMRRAVRDLAREVSSVSEVAWELGFEHLSGFDRDFHRTLKLSPSEFRRLCRALGVTSA